MVYNFYLLGRNEPQASIAKKGEKELKGEVDINI